MISSFFFFLQPLSFLKTYLFAPWYPLFTMLQNYCLAAENFLYPPVLSWSKYFFLKWIGGATSGDNTRLAKTWTAIGRLSIIWKSDLADKMNRSFFQAAAVSILLYGGTTWTLIERMEKKLDGNYTRMLRAILNKSWRQHPTKQQQYCHLPPTTKLDEPDMQPTAEEAGTSS